MDIQTSGLPGKKELLEAFASRRIARPDHRKPNFTDLVRAALEMAGAGRGLPAPTPRSRELLSMVERAHHEQPVLFVLVDGMGYDLVSSVLPETSFLRTRTRARLQSVFPSTTAAALTTYCTGVWPCEHCVPGWWTYLPERQLGIISLPFRERRSGRDLSELGVPLEEVFPCPSAWRGAERRVLNIKPETIVQSAYSTYSDGGNPAIGYSDLDDAFALAAKELREARDGRFHYLYLPQLDTISHLVGPDDESVAALLTDIDARISDLCEGLGDGVRLIVTADHGHKTVPSGKRFMLTADDPLLARLHSWPSGEPVVPIFHVLEGREDEFAKGFCDRTRGAFCLLTPEEVEELSLLGPGCFPGPLRQRLGTMVGLAREPAALLVRHEGDTVWQHVGYHAGLSEAEMYVPLVVA
ncbi:alkaline phosphatase family protein [Candidatus Fermentibacterales bacterium]|nr:alkaline phosphatase family protein [Candidatus Fermentibacterales bacterium]